MSARMPAIRQTIRARRLAGRVYAVRARQLCPLDIAQRRLAAGDSPMSRSCRWRSLTERPRHAVDPDQAERRQRLWLSHFGAPQARWRSVAQEIVAQTTLDDVVAALALDRLDFIKADIEGWECGCCAAPATPRPVAARLLLECRPSTWPAPATRSEDASRSIRAHRPRDPLPAGYGSGAGKEPLILRRRQRRMSDSGSCRRNDIAAVVGPMRR